MGPGHGLLQFEVGTAGDHLAAMLDKAVHHLAQGQHPGTVVDNGQHDDAEGGLQLGLLVELVEQHLGVLVPLDLDHDPHPVAVGFVADFGDPLDLLLLDQFGNLLDQAGLVDLVGELGDDDRLAFGLLGRLHMGLGADLDDAATGGVGVLDPLTTVDGGAGGKVRARHQLPATLQR